jgi:hypothetical protein
VLIYPCYLPVFAWPVLLVKEGRSIRKISDGQGRVILVNRSLQMDAMGITVRRDPCHTVRNHHQHLRS